MTTVRSKAVLIPSVFLPLVTGSLSTHFERQPSRCTYGQAKYATWSLTNVPIG